MNLLVIYSVFWGVFSRRISMNDYRKVITSIYRMIVYLCCIFALNACSPML